MRLVDVENLCIWIRKLLGIRKRRFYKRLFNWLQPKTQSNIRGKPSLNQTHQLIFDAWIENSTLSVDRRDGRDSVRLPLNEYKATFHGIVTNLITKVTNKRNTELVQAQRYMCHFTTQKMKDILKEKHDVTIPSERERERNWNVYALFAATPDLCLMLYNVVPKKQGFKLYTSVTSYYTTDGKCTTNKNCYILQDCITGDCKDCNGLINPQNYSFQSSDTVTYYQFQSMPTGKLNKNGKPKYKTKRTNYNCVPAEECKQKLDGVSKNYILHRFDAINDKMFWPLIMEACKSNQIKSNQIKSKFIFHTTYINTI